MISSFYFVMMLVTAGNLVYLAQKKYKHTDRYLWTLMMLIPIIIFGYWMKSTVHGSEAAMIAMCFIYLFNTVAPVIGLFIILQLIGVKITGVTKSCVYGITTAHLLSIWLSKDTTLYYSTLEVRENFLGSATIMTSGPLKFTHYLFLGIICVAIIIAVAYGMLRKEGYPKRVFKIYISIIAMGMGAYVIEVLFNFDFSTLPLVYTIASFVMTFRYDHYQSYDIMNLIGEKQSKTGLRGFASLDKNRCLLEYNRRFAELIPEIRNVERDVHFEADERSLLGKLQPAIDLFEEEGIDTRNIELDDRIYSLTVSTFSVNEKNELNGYLLEIADITEETRRREIIERYNERLSKEVKDKTEHIADIQNTVVLGLANMIENRDDNTGGHVKRTSDVIKLLVEEASRRKIYDIDEQMAVDIIKAAPMHDLGKISIDNAILCKPGKLTDDEFSIMRTHASKSGEIVRFILAGVEEQHFVDVAFNVARHHHERWDGKGYPDRLLGERIPVEARIMAVADVYDALVSKRCYKEAMSFEKAFEIMNDCMGSQFDPAMRPVFIACRSRLESYYSGVNQSN